MATAETPRLQGDLARCDRVGHPSPSGWSVQWRFASPRPPRARTIARLMTVARDNLSRSETITVATIEERVSLLIEAREVVGRFQTMVPKKTLADLEPWLEHACSSLVASFAAGVLRSRDAVSAAFSLPWSNGHTKGQITSFKLVKRQMYGRRKIDLLQARVIGAQQSAATPKLCQTPVCQPIQGPIPGRLTLHNQGSRNGCRGAMNHRLPARGRTDCRPWHCKLRDRRVLLRQMRDGKRQHIQQKTYLLATKRPAGTKGRLTELELDQPRPTVLWGSRPRSFVSLDETQSNPMLIDMVCDLRLNVVLEGRESATDH